VCRYMFCIHRHSNNVFCIVKILGCKSPISLDRISYVEFRMFMYYLRRFNVYLCSCACYVTALHEFLFTSWSWIGLTFRATTIYNKLFYISVTSCFLNIDNVLIKLEKNRQMLIGYIALDKINLIYSFFPQWLSCFK